MKYLLQKRDEYDVWKFCFESDNLAEIVKYLIGESGHFRVCEVTIILEL